MAFKLFAQCQKRSLFLGIFRSMCWSAYRWATFICSSRRQLSQMKTIVAHFVIPSFLSYEIHAAMYMDKTQLTLLALFDVSAAFDSVDHEILLRRLSITFGINELPLAWITSYLSDRSSSVLFHSSRSRWRPTPFGLPQGSVLGPLLYILFTADIGPLLASCSLASHSYADDVQAYK